MLELKGDATIPGFLFKKMDFVKDGEPTSKIVGFRLDFSLIVLPLRPVFIHLKIISSCYTLVIFIETIWILFIKTIALWWQETVLNDFLILFLV